VNSARRASMKSRPSVAIAPMAAASWTSPLDSPRAIAPIAPTAAPPETPRTYGSASGLVQLAAAIGAMATLGLLFMLARRALFTRDALESEQGTTAVLLTGVMIASFAAALLSLVLSLAPDARLRTMVFWLLGDLAGATDLRTALIALGAIGVAFAIALRHAAALNLLVRGDLQAYTQGVRVAHTRRTLVPPAPGCAAFARPAPP
jgi:iron complex transport system permease protein